MANMENMDNMTGYVNVTVDDRLRKLLEEIFTDSFMQEHTNFENFSAFQYSSAVIANWNAPEMVYAEYLMDKFVQESTEFQSFDEMVRVAADLKFAVA